MAKLYPRGASIPGQSLTEDPKNIRPPKYSDPNDALLNIFDSLTKEENLPDMLDMMDKKNGGRVSVEDMAKTVIFTGAVENSYSWDVAMLIGPQVAQTIATLATRAGIDFEIASKKIGDAKGAARKKMHISLFDNIAQKNKTKEMEKSVEEGEKTAGKGLMARPVHHEGGKNNPANILLSPKTRPGAKAAIGKELKGGMSLGQSAAIGDAAAKRGFTAGVKEMSDNKLSKIVTNILEIARKDEIAEIGPEINKQISNIVNGMDKEDKQNFIASQLKVLVPEIGGI